jgi:catechol 2,3-dioxygenase-like lactoylglutathione lyase family enzyme
VDVLASRILLHPSDLDRSRRFYGETLGLAVFREFGGGTVFFLGNGLLEVSAHRHASDGPSDATRLLLQVRDVEAEHARLRAAGVPVDAPPARMPWGLIEMTARDPDGLALVLVEVPADHPQRRAG